MSDHTLPTATIESRTIVRLALTQAQQLTQVMSRAFFNDPMFLYTLPDESTRHSLLCRFFRFLIRYGTGYGEIYTTPNTDGGAVWISPQNTTVTLGQIFHTGALRLPFVFGWTGFVRFMRLNNLVDNWHKEAIPDKHWYLAGLGVDPVHQGNGVGGALIKPILKRADAEGMPCYLETFTERNLPFYERHGFRIAISGEVPGDGPMVWAMTRSPQ